MAMRAATMSRMDTTPTTRESGSPFRKSVLLLLLMSAAALLIALLFQRQAALPLLLSTFFADVSLGLVAGFGSRFVLQRQSLFVRSLAAILLALLGMLLIGYITHWVLGVGPVALDSRSVNQLQKISFDRNPFDQIRAMNLNWGRLVDFNELDWADPIHMAISLVLAGLSLDAWSRVPVPEPAELVPVLTQAAATPVRRRKRAAPAAANGRSQVHLPESWFPRLRPSPTPQRRNRSNGRFSSPVPSEAKVAKEPVVRPKRRRSRRKPKIQFAIIEEHRCPYCLDAVTRTDPRGVKECEVCHTLHHADCWAITGICQVPHLNT